MIELVKYQSIHKETWDNIVSNSKNGTFLFYRDYMDYHSDKFIDYSFTIHKNKQVIALIPGHISNFTYHSHQGLTYGGLIMTNKINTVDVLEVFQELIRLLRELQISEIIYKPTPKIYHQLPSDEDSYALFINGAERISCNTSTAIYLNNKLPFRDLRKRRIQNSRKHGITITENLDFIGFWKILKQNLSSKYNERPTHTENEITLLQKRFPENIKLILAYQGELILAGVVLYINRNIIHLQYIAASEKGKDFGALDQLFDELINHKFSDQYIIDFGISTESNGNYLNKGLIFQKEGFGGRAIVYESYKIDLHRDNEMQAPKTLVEPIMKYGVILRLVEIEDAEFILNLRTDPKLNKYISPTSPVLEEQTRWLHKYKMREKEGLEYYFVVLDLEGKRYGTIRLYNRGNNCYEIGSWLFAHNSPLGMAVKAHIIGYELGFELFNADYCKFEIRKENTAVLRYIEFYKPQIIDTDELNYYFHLTKENFYLNKNKIAAFSSGVKEKISDVFIHQTAEVQSKFIGSGTCIWQYCVVLKNARIGKNCNLNFNVFIENDVIIGNNVTIKSGVQLWDGIELEDNTFISPNVTFTNDFKPRSKQYPDKFLKTIVKEGASIGANSTVIGGLTIGKYAMIGAGSVVTKNIPDYSLWYGVPAVFKGYVCKCGQKLDNLFVCTNCHTPYKLSNEVISEL